MSAGYPVLQNTTLTTKIQPKYQILIIMTSIFGCQQKEIVIWIQSMDDENFIWDKFEGTTKMMKYIYHMKQNKN